jgi:hypothetical protein
MIRRYFLFAFTLCVFTLGHGQTSDDSLTVDERLATIELQLAMLDSRLNTQAAVDAGSFGSSESALAAQIRIDALEREVNDLRLAVRDLSRQVDTAKREAAEARRAARDALSRIR